MDLDYQQLIYAALSVLFNVVFVVLGEIFYLKCHWKHENARKFIHIAVSHWWIVASLTITDTFYASLPPILFILLNAASFRWKLVKSIERNRGTEDLGTIYYAVALLVLVLWTWGTANSYFAMIGVLVLGYGDGFAAVIGKTYPWYPFSYKKHTKTLSGTLAMFITSFLVISLCLLFRDMPFLLPALYLASVATIFELFTPCGFDNLTIPLSVTFFGSLL